MSFQIRRVRQGDAAILATIQTSSWKAAFQDIISDKDMEKCTNMNKSARAFYERNGFGLTEKTKLTLGATEVCYVKSLV